MKSLTRPTSLFNFLSMLLILWPVTFSAPTQAQDNAVYNSSGTNTTHSKAFIDAYVLLNGVPYLDLCDTIYHILKPITYLPAVIDARGISGSALTCTLGSPWSEGSSYANVPSTILLPAGTIITSVPWVLPTNTKLIGVAKGTNSSGNNYLSETTIESQFNGGAVIQFGDSTHCPSSGCQGISVEHLTIYGFGNIVNGIENDNCGLLCYADHVTMYQVLGTGLNVSGVNATDSGPYSNITYDVGNSPNSSTQCAKIINTNHVPHSRPFFPGSA